MSEPNKTPSLAESASATPAPPEVVATQSLTAGDLRGIALFAGLGDEVFEHFASTLQARVLQPGTVVFREGDPARALFVLLAGELEVTKQSRRGSEARVAILGPNDTFGEMSLLDMQPRSATVRTLSPVRLVEFGADALDDLYRRDVRAYALLVLNLARDLSRRLRVADGLVASFAATFADEYPGRANRPAG